MSGPTPSPLNVGGTPSPSPGTPQSHGQGGHPQPLPPNLSAEALAKIVGFLQKTGFRGAEAALLREAAERGADLAAMGFAVPPPLQPPPQAEPSPAAGEPRPGSAASVGGSGSGLLGSHVRGAGEAGALASFAGLFAELQGFVQRASLRLRPELGTLLYPCYAHMYLELVASEKAAEAAEFRTRFAACLDPVCREDVERLNRVRSPGQLESNELVEAVGGTQFQLRLCKESLNALKPLLEAQPNLANFLRRHLAIEALDAQPRSAEVQEWMSGGLLGEVTKNANKAKVLHGLAKEESSAVLAQGDDDDAAAKKKKASSSHKDKRRQDPNAPPSDRIPLPDLSESLKAERRAAGKELGKRLRIGPDSLPSACLYTLLNAPQGLCAAEISEDSTLAYMGQGDSRVVVHSLAPGRLKPLKSLDQLELLDKDAEDIQSQMLDESSAKPSVSLVGHSGPVYGVSGSPDRRLLLSGSGDGTVRLWSLQLFAPLTSYRLAGFPIWDVAFCPRGFYFASGGADKLGLVWCTERMQPLRVLAGHYADVNTVCFHPNSNYVATGGRDRAVRIWDLLDGKCVRHLVGHKGAVESLCWSPDGRHLASGGREGGSLVWDFAQGRLATAIQGSGPVNALAFSRDGQVLASGSGACEVAVHQLSSAEAGRSAADAIVAGEHKGFGNAVRLATFVTKSTPLVALHWTRKNVLLGAGVFQP